MDAAIYKEMSEQEDHHWWFVARREIIRSILKKRPLQQNASSCALLEIGSGTGGNLAMLSEFGAVTAMELSEDAIVYARKKWKDRVLQGGLPSDIKALKGKTFDAIFMLDVLEHVKEDKESIQALEKILKKNGMLLLTVPAFPLLWSNHDVIHHHYRRYTRNSLLKIFDSGKWQVEFISYYNAFLFPLLASQRLISRYFFFKKDRLTHAPLKRPNTYLNALLQYIFSLEKYCMPRYTFPFGASLVAVLRYKP